MMVMMFACPGDSLTATMQAAVVRKMFSQSTKTSVRIPTECILVGFYILVYIIYVPNMYAHFSPRAQLNSH